MAAPRSLFIVFGALGEASRITPSRGGARHVARGCRVIRRCSDRCTRDRRSRGDSDVFFFDRVSRGALTVAQAARERGAVIVFEPSAVGDPRLFHEAWALAHVVKYSHERLRDIADLEFAPGERDGVVVEIETLGRGRGALPKLVAAGETRGWVTMSAFCQSEVRDAAGQVIGARPECWIGWREAGWSGYARRIEGC